MNLKKKTNILWHCTCPPIFPSFLVPPLCSYCRGRRFKSTKTIILKKIKKSFSCKKSRNRLKFIPNTHYKLTTSIEVFFPRKQLLYKDVYHLIILLPKKCGQQLLIDVFDYIHTNYANLCLIKNDIIWSHSNIMIVTPTYW